MFFLSQLLGTPLEDQQGVRVGKVIDVLIPAELVGRSEAVYPDALLIEGEEELSWRVPFAAIEWHDHTPRLRVPLAQLSQTTEQPQEIHLAREVQDRQVIDVEHKKAVRVNDVCFGADWRILGIDNSTLGLIRRLAPAWLLGEKGKLIPPSLIPWSDIELISQPQAEREQEVPAAPLFPRPQTPSGHLAELHPADLAEIMHQISAAEGARLIERFDDETAAAVMEEVDTERQRQILENIDSARAADILQAMGPDEAADLLAQLPQERAQALLRLMEPEESEDVQELLEYEANTAGGLMTTDYIALNQEKTVSEALAAVRDNIQENNVRTAYIYCVEDETQEEQRILGVASLWDLLIAPPTQKLADLMETDVITVRVDSNPQDVAEIMAKYNLLAVPVVSEDGLLQGVVTVDDVLDILLPPERRRKPTRMY
ncbi:MAG: magnesium transporter [Ktedonobacteraceae bacterium]|nr:magnesium transporter [Ktedonobacteraceae bacterium]